MTNPAVLQKFRELNAPTISAVDEVRRQINRPMQNHEENTPLYSSGYEAKYTPPVLYVDGHNLNNLIVDNGTGYEIVLTCKGPNGPELAKFLKTAGNNHAALVAALEKTQHHLLQNHQGDLATTALLDTIETALKNAKA